MPSSSDAPWSVLRDSSPDGPLITSFPGVAWLYVGAALANKIGAGFVPAARYGALPGKTISVQCSGGYHHDVDSIKELTLREDDLKKGANVLVVDDILGTGHTSAACVELARKLGANVVGAAFILEINQLQGRSLLKSVEDVFSLMQI